MAEKEPETASTTATTSDAPAPVAPAAPAVPAPLTAETTIAPAALADDDDDFEDVPDPDEDDLDDLDDLLDDFSAAQIETKAPAPSGAGRPAAAVAVEGAAAAADEAGPQLDDMLQDEDFAKQLQADMADLLGEIQTSPEMQAQFETLFKELGDVLPDMDGTAVPGIAPPLPTTAPPSAAAPTARGPATTTTATSAAASASASAAPAASDASFQDTIRRTMERMQASGEQATAAAAETSTGDDLLSEFMKQMQSGGLGGGGDEDELSKMLVGMMEELTNREILYEPMKELNDKFPTWMAQNRATTATDDLARYKIQQTIVGEIVARFELSSYSDANAADREYIVDRMQKMQAAGSPPPDLVGDMPSAQDALAAPDESCNPQ